MLAFDLIIPEVLFQGSFGPDIAKACDALHKSEKAYDSMITYPVTKLDKKLRIIGSFCVTRVTGYFSSLIDQKAKRLGLDDEMKRTYLIETFNNLLKPIDGISCTCVFIYSA